MSETTKEERLKALSKASGRSIAENEKQRELCIIDKKGKKVSVSPFFSELTENQQLAALAIAKQIYRHPKRTDRRNYAERLAIAAAEKEGNDLSKKDFPKERAGKWEIDVR